MKRLFQLFFIVFIANVTVTAQIGADFIEFDPLTPCQYDCPRLSYTIEGEVEGVTFELLHASCDPQGLMTMTPDGQLIECIWNFQPVDECSLVVASYVFQMDSLFTTELDTIRVVLDGIDSYNQLLTDACHQGSTGEQACDRVCEGTQVRYWLQEPLEEYSYTITGPGEVISDDGTGIVVEWGDAGEGGFFISWFGACGEGSDYRCIEIVEEPTAVADISDASAPFTFCLGEWITFENLSEGGIEYHWQFGDGHESDLFEPRHSYDQAGTYTVTLAVKSTDCGCVHDTTLTLEVLDLPAPSLSCVSTLCPGDTGRYVATTENCGTHLWTVIGDYTTIDGGDAEDDYIDIVWHSGPEGIIELVVEDCDQAYCDEPARFRIPVISPDGPIDGDAYVCAGDVVTYSAPDYPGATYTWSVPAYGQIISDADPSSSVITVLWAQVNVPTAATVSVLYDHCYLGCGGQDELQVQILPTLLIQGPIDACLHDEVQFGTMTSFTGGQPIPATWSMIDAQGQVIWSEGTPSEEITIELSMPAGDYQIRAEAADPTRVCEPVVRTNLRIHPEPDAPHEIRADPFICIGRVTSFEIDEVQAHTAHFVVIDGTDSVMVDGARGSYVFQSGGPYAIQAYYVRLGQGCLSPRTTIVRTPMDPLTITGSDEKCLGDRSAYTVDVPEGYPVEWSISPAEAGVISDSELSTCSVTWNATGIHELRAASCGEVASIMIEVHALPEPEVLHPAGVCQGELAQVQTTQSYSNYLWLDSADLALASTASVEVGAGYYGVQVTDENGCQASQAFHLESYPTPSARLSTTDDTYQCTGPTAQMYAIIDDATDYSISWFFDDQPLNHSGDQYTATSFGRYRYEVTNQFGCTNVSNEIELVEFCQDCRGGVCNKEVCNGDPCIVYGDIDLEMIRPNCNERTYRPVDLSSFEPGSVRWAWETEDGTYQSIAANEFSYTFQEAGYYVIILRGRLIGYPYADALCYHVMGLRDTIPAVADMDWTGICQQQDIEFRDLTTFIPGTSITNWNWDFGDGHTSTEQSPVHVYAASGAYQVQLEVTSSTGCQSRTSGVIDIQDVDSAKIVIDDVRCESEVIHAALLSRDSAYQVSWDFGDASTEMDTISGLTEVAYSYPAAGSYTIQVSWENVLGCKADLSDQLDIEANTLAGSIGFHPDTVICEGQVTTLSAPPGGLSWSWNTEETLESIEVDSQGHYGVEVVDDHGCRYQVEQFVYVLGLPPIDVQGRELSNEEVLWTDEVEVCEGTDVEVEGFSVDGADILWHNGWVTPRLIFSADAGTGLNSGSHDWIAVAEDEFGCSSAPDTIRITVHPSPDPFTVVLDQGSGCSSSPNTLSVTPIQTGTTYTWSDGQEGSSIEVRAAGTYHVTVTTDQGCEGYAQNTVTISPSPSVDLFPSGCYIRCGSDTICLPPIPGVAYYELRRDGEVIQSGAQPPAVFIVDSSGSYTFYAEHVNGCADESEPLNLEIRPGYGDIHATVWVDVDGDGVVSTADTAVHGVKVDLQQSVADLDSSMTGAGGDVSFIDWLAGDYTIAVDLTDTSVFYEIIGQVDVGITRCHERLEVDLLLGWQCADSTPSIERHTLCYGDSLTIDGTVYTSADSVTIVLPTAEGCDSLVTHIIQVEDSIAYAADISPTCEDEMSGRVSIEVDNSVQVVWQDNGATARVRDGLEAGTYEIELRRGDCMQTIQVEVPQLTLSTYDLLFDDPNCPDDAVAVELVTSGALPWGIVGMPPFTNPSVELVAGDYLVYVGEDDCFDTTALSITDPVLPALALPDVVEVFVGENYVIHHSLEDSTGYAFLWMPQEAVSCDACANPTFIGEADTELTLQVMTEDGCVIEGGMLFVVDDQRAVYIPNAFTPNNDGVNDVFMPYPFHGRATMMQVFDRWGNEVYQETVDMTTQDVMRGWTGRRLNGARFEMGTYIYKVHVEFIDGTTRMLVGDVALIL